MTQEASERYQSVLKKGVCENQEDLEVCLDFELYDLALPFMDRLYESAVNIQEKIQYTRQQAIILYYDLCDFDGFLGVSHRLLSEHNLSFEDFKREIIFGVLGDQNWVVKRQFLEKLIHFVQDTQDKLSILEYLAFILEKKFFFAEGVSKLYGRILNLYPKHLKALRFFKNFFFHEGQYKKSLEYMDKLIEYSADHREVQRLAQEKANLLCYQLKRYEEALRVLETYCGNRKVSIRKITTDLYMFLNQTEEMIHFLIEIYPQIPDSQERKQFLDILMSRLDSERMYKAVKFFLRRFPHDYVEPKLDDLVYFYYILKNESFYLLIPEFLYKLRDIIKQEEDVLLLNEFYKKHFYAD